MSFNNEHENQDKWQNDPDNWIWGIFYYNPEDSRLFPPKRIKQLGWTINFANPNSVFLIIVIIAIAFIFS
ncbi:DUF5808 domain-containing protein [Flavobacterium sp. LC2016-12]|uniref:DUF5808 domain-containing protein n=1 Tax=Flavobacterium sp. LC2016-12 TaxID=2783794 RepID=UPI00188BB5D1|nr:DUF5808 domain-containing protein [Flavobacterium sp. LC2016-12]MBF4465888.1 hypothetical protein [Flavobacterium sp. LC2016-12]